MNELKKKLLDLIELRNQIVEMLEVTLKNYR